MPVNFSKSSYKIAILSLLISAFIVSNAYFVSVYHTYSSYDFIWVWATKSIVNNMQFFYVGFLLNLLAVSSIIYAVLLWFKPLQSLLLKRYKLICGGLLIGIILTNGGFMVFDTKVYPVFLLEMQNKSDNPINTQVFYRYFTVGSDNYLASGGCDVPD